MNKRPKSTKAGLSGVGNPNKEEEAISVKKEDRATSERDIEIKKEDVEIGKETGKGGEHSERTINADEADDHSYLIGRIQDYDLIVHTLDKFQSMRARADGFEPLARLKRQEDDHSTTEKKDEISRIQTATEKLDDVKAVISELNTVLDDEYRIGIEEFDSFVEQQEIEPYTQESLEKYIQFKYIGKLVDHRVKIKDLSTVVLIRNFKKIAKRTIPRFQLSSVVTRDQYPVLVAGIREELAPFDEIHPNILSDLDHLKMIKSQDTLSNEQTTYLEFVNDCQMYFDFI